MEYSRSSFLEQLLSLSTFEIYVTVAKISACFRFHSCSAFNITFSPSRFIWFFWSKHLASAYSNLKAILLFFGAIRKYCQRRHRIHHISPTVTRFHFVNLGRRSILYI
ncbi:unnamed protein product [Acanthoscelides obtectus]|uniref:Uncharacterized protein n=1 Tax=Acanthoscelides obtectus TaxID=200917 RepID=A0A9P0PC72_ACAOB|nr:unnamed protein product [Acanthoscelides obtectus]CAK1646555.1 hypothetical protein AOBTE_LOCUS14706 [Acanthoscelides obtectus]